MLIYASLESRISIFLNDHYLILLLHSSQHGERVEPQDW